MYAVISGTTCPVIVHAVEPLVLHPRYQALRVQALAPDVGIHVLRPVCRRSHAAFERDGIDGILVTWIGDVMEEIDVTETAAVQAEIDT